MRFGISLPVRELGDDIVAIKEFAQHDVVRHPLVQKIINAYETRRNRE